MIKPILKLFLLFNVVFTFISCSSALRYETDRNEKVSNSNSISKTEIGEASFYSEEFNGRITSNGEKYNMNDLTAAHPTYPFNTILRVTNLSSNKSVIVRVNDRMPNFKGRIIDLSLAAAKKIDMINVGVQKVKIEVIKWGGQ